MRVLVADDEPLSREFLQEALQALGCEVRTVADGQAAIDALAKEAFDVLLTDLRMPRADGMEVLAASREQQPNCQVVLVTAHGTMHVAVAAMREGAVDVLEKPVELDAIEILLERLRERQQLVRENAFLREEVAGDELLVASDKMHAIVQLVERVAPSKASVLIRGESGTGKERLAALVHKRSERAHRPFVKLNCAALPENLLESELFGHEAGAFTGAAKRREGRFELAHTGTLFLDEVGEMSASMQAKLLRVLQEGEFERVGGTSTVHVDVRLVAATNRDLDREVEAGDFRRDLLYRLDVVPLWLPPLRERSDEILPLAKHFLRQGLSLDADAEQALREWTWPGNVRELQNLIERVSLMCDSDRIGGSLVRRWLAPALHDESAPHVGNLGACQMDAEEPVVLIPRPDGAASNTSRQELVQMLVGLTLAAVEAELIERTLKHCDGNRTRTAEMLGIGVRTLFNKLKLCSKSSTKVCEAPIP
ncbi:MAG: sigma-54-dependent transcriptional regulator [Planctomycetota bacterium]